MMSKDCTIHMQHFGSQENFTTQTQLLNSVTDRYTNKIIRQKITSKFS